MTPKQRVLAALSRQPLDRMPVDLWHTPEVGAALRRHFGVEDDLALYRAMGLDKIVWVFPPYAAAAPAAPAGGDDGPPRGLWGIRTKTVQAGMATYNESVQPPMDGYETAADVERFPYWPDPGRYDYASAGETARRCSAEFAVIGPWVSFFEIYCKLRGLEQSLMDLIERPGFVDEVLDRIEHAQTEMMKRYFQQAARFIDLVFISDDMGSQAALLMAPEMWERHFRRRMVRWVDLVHSFGIRVFFHTDGASEPLVRPLIECGIDVLNPIQHACPGMDMAGLKRKYGRDVIFHGGVDNQTVLPFGTPDDVRRETRACLETLGGDREGFICCSCHNVQPGTPVGNVLAMVETVKAW